MSATSPAPDHDTMESLIDTNEQLQASMNLHQRAMLSARKQSGARDAADEEPSPMTDTAGPDYNSGPASRRYTPVSDEEDAPHPRVSSGGRPGGGGKGKLRELEQSSAAGGSRSHTPRGEEDDPFRDPEPSSAYQAGGSASGVVRSGKGKAREDEDDNDAYQQQRLFNEPYHPGFGATPSYLGRQESALDKEAMSGAIAGGSSSSSSRPPQLPPKPRDSEDRTGEPTYRY